MNITVFGGTGGNGKKLFAPGPPARHDVTAVVRDPSRLPINNPALTVVTLPGLEDPDLLVPALRGCDAVLSAIGPRGRKDAAVASPCTRTIVSAMQKAGVDRLVAVSA